MRVRVPRQRLPRRLKRCRLSAVQHLLAMIASSAFGPDRGYRETSSRRGTLASDPTTSRWHFVVDNLNTHCSESLVRYVAEASGSTVDLGEKESHGILQSMVSRLQSMVSRAAFLTDPSHTIVFHYTPKHASLRPPPPY